MDSSLLTGTVAGNEDRYHRRILVCALTLVEPSDAIIRQVKFVLLLQVNRSRDYGRDGDDHQQCTNELLPQFLHAADLAHY
jgi:hypothetical protein